MNFTYEGIEINGGQLVSWTEYVRNFPVRDDVFYIDPTGEYSATWINPNESSLVAYAKEKGMIQDPVLYSQAEVVWQYKTNQSIQTVCASSLEEAYKHAKRKFPESLVSEFERVIAP